LVSLNPRRVKKYEALKLGAPAGANLINVLAAFLSLCPNFLSGFLSYKKLTRLDFLLGLKKASSPRTLSINLWLNLGLKPQERVTNKSLELGHASVGA